MLSVGCNAKRAELTMGRAQPSAAPRMPMTAIDLPLREKKAFSVREFCALYGVGRNKAYEEIKAGRLLHRKKGRRTLIPRDAADAWLNAPSELERR
jgi:excisionase family DNA binding protein